MFLVVSSVLLLILWNMCIVVYRELYYSSFDFMSRESSQRRFVYVIVEHFLFSEWNFIFPFFVSL